MSHHNCVTMSGHSCVGHTSVGLCRESACVVVTVIATVIANANANEPYLAATLHDHGTPVGERKTGRALLAVTNDAAD